MPIQTQIKVQTKTGIAWIDEYTRWAMQRSPLTPEHFHQNIALALVSGCIARRVHIQLPHDKVRPNLYTLIIATTGVYAKTTALKAARELAHEVMPDRLFSSVSTPEAMIGELSGVKPVNFDSLSPAVQQAWKDSQVWGARRLFVLDEAGRFFNGLERDYNATLDTIMMELYDANDHALVRQTQRHGILQIENPGLSCLFATTPGNIRQLLLADAAWQSGFWARWNFVAAHQLTAWNDSQYHPAPTSLIRSLSEFSNDLGVSEQAASIQVGVVKEINQFTKNVRDLIQNEPDEDRHGMLVRLPSKRIKAALCFATLENPKRPEVKASHWQASEFFSLGWERDAQLAVELSKHTRQSSVEEKVYSVLIAYMNSGISAREIQQLTHLDARETKDVLNSFLKNGTIRPEKAGKKILWVVNQ